MKCRPSSIYLTLSAGLVGIGTLSILRGPTDLFVWSHLFDFLFGRSGEEVRKAWLVFTELRLPRVVLAGQVGAALGVSGALLQSYFKNPLAEPYVLGLSSGAGFGAVAWSALVAGWSGVTFGGMVAAFAGAWCTVLIVVLVARSHGVLMSHKLLLGGVALGVLFASLTTGLLLTASTDQFRALLTWLMGSVAYRGWAEIGLLGPAVILGVAISVRMWRELDWLAVDEEAAFTAGVEVDRVKWILLTAAVLLASASVAICGAVAFVGLMVPHALRMLGGASHKHLLIQSALGGALLVMSADLAGRVFLPGVELPLSLVTSVLGAVFFLFLLRTKVR